MNRSRSRTRRWRPARAAGFAVGVLTTVSLAAACSTGETAATSSTSTTTTTTTTAPLPVPEVDATDEEPPAPEWVVQVGGADDDSLRDVAARDDELVAVGHTEGEPGGAGNGGADALSVLVTTEAEVTGVLQSGSELDDIATSVGSSGSATLACGQTTGGIGGLPGGAEDGWCAPVGPDGSLGTTHQQGGTESDSILGVALAADGEFGYAGGYTLGLFPGASDTSAGQLGNGDALVWQIGADGTPRWIRQFGTAAADRGRAVSVTDDGDGLIVGETGGDLEGPSNGGTDAFLARFDRDGIPRFVRQFGSAEEDSASAVAAGGEPTRGTETFVVAGHTEGALAPALGGELTDPTDAPRADGAEPAPTNAGGTDAVLWAMDPGGDERWTVQLGSTGADEATAVAIDGSTVLVAGTTSGALDTTGAPSSGGLDGFLAAVDLDTGALRWITQFGSEGDETVGGMTITEDGLVVVAGSTTAAMGDNVNAGRSDGFLIAFPLPAVGGAAASAL